MFEQATAPGPWTIPSCASLFTSTFPCEHNFLTRFEKLNPSFDTLAERLSRAGYTTYAMFGNEFIGPSFGMSQGFRYPIGGGRVGGRKIEAALQRFPPAPSAPLMLYIHNMEPHDPYHYAPPHIPGFRDIDAQQRAQIKEDFHKYKEAGEFDYRQGLPLGTNDQTDEQHARLERMFAMRDDWSELYDAAVRLADSRIGTTIETLKRLGHWDNTLFILISDHGEEMGEHGGWLHDQSVYQEMVHVPLIVRFPGDRHAGQRIKTPVSTLDLLPTLMDYLGRAELADGARGRSLLPLIAGGDPADQEELRVTGMRINTTRYFVPWQQERGDVNLVVRKGRMKGIWNVNLETLELYDLELDPGEQNDVAETYPELAAAMTAEAEQWYAACVQVAVESAELGDLPPDVIRRLQAVGYVGGGEQHEFAERDPNNLEIATTEPREPNDRGAAPDGDDDE